MSKAILNSNSNRSRLAYIVKNSKVNTDTVKTIGNTCIDVANDFSNSHIYPDVVTVRHKIRMKKQLGYTDTMNKSIKCKQYGNLFLDFDRNKFQTVWSDVDMQNFKKAVVLACDFMRKEQGHVAILGVRELLRKNGILIIDLQIVSAIVKKYLINNPNPKTTVVRRNTVRHNDDRGQVCPVNTGSIAFKSDTWIRQAMTSEW